VQVHRAHDRNLVSREKEPLMTRSHISNASSPANVTRIAMATAGTVFRNKIQALGIPFYVLTFTTFPIFQLLLVALIYRDNETLQSYAVIGGAGTAIIFAMLFVGGEIMEGERSRGMLGNLFISPAPRFAWLLCFQLSAICEALVSAIATIVLGVLIFGTPLSINVLSVLVTLVLLIVCMWGIGMMLSAVGTAIRNSNQLSNLLFPILTPLAGTMFPISAMPDWLRIPARCMPFGYGMQALFAAMTRNAPLMEIRGDLLPLTGFAIVLPVLGMLAFRRLEQYARIQGHLEMV